MHLLNESVKANVAVSGYTWARDDGEAVVEAARNNG
jgi:hypothetical protein